MKKIFNIALLLSICTVANTHASDDKTQQGTVQQYPFSDYDRNVFTNHVTNKLELIYSTPFIESLPNDPMTFPISEVELLFYPALTRITYKQQQLAGRLEVGCRWPSFAQTDKEKNDEKRYWTKEAEYRTQLNQVKEEVQGLNEHFHTTSSYTNIPIRELMRTVQYAARKIIYGPLDTYIVVSADDDSQLFAANIFLKQLLTKYRAHEQQ